MPSATTHAQDMLRLLRDVDVQQRFGLLDRWIDRAVRQHLSRALWARGQRTDAECLGALPPFSLATLAEYRDLLRSLAMVTAFGDDDRVAARSAVSAMPVYLVVAALDYRTSAGHDDKTFAMLVASIVGAARALGFGDAELAQQKADLRLVHS